MGQIIVKWWGKEGLAAEDHMHVPHVSPTGYYVPGPGTPGSSKECETPLGLV